MSHIGIATNDLCFLLFSSTTPRFRYRCRVFHQRGQLYLHFVRHTHTHTPSFSRLELYSYLPHLFSLLRQGRDVQYSKGEIRFGFDSCVKMLPLQNRARTLRTDSLRTFPIVGPSISILQAGKLGFDTTAVLRRVQRDPPRHERGGRRRDLRGVPARRQGFHTDQPLLLRQHPGTDQLTLLTSNGCCKLILVATCKLQERVVLVLLYLWIIYKEWFYFTDG